MTEPATFDRPARRMAARFACVAVAGLSFGAFVATPAAGQSAEQVMADLVELDIDFVGIAADMPDRQNLGERDTPGGLVVYAWDRERTPDDRVAREHLLTVDHLRVAGIPAVEGSSPEFEAGMFGPQRYRLGGTITSIDIQGESRYEIRVGLDWQLYDTESSSLIWEGSSRSMQRGAVLGDRGEPDNVLLSAVLDALDSVLEDDIPDAIDDNE